MITMVALGPIESNSNGYSIRIEHLMDSLLRHDEVTLIEFDIAEPRGGGETRYHLVEYDAVYRERRIGDFLNKTITFNPLGQLKMQLTSLRGLWRNRDLLKRSDAVFIEGALFPFAIILCKLFRKKVVMDTHCVNLKLAMDFKGHNRTAYLLRRLAWGPLEYFAYRLCDVIVFVSDEEVRFSESTLRMDRRKAVVIPNVLDIPPLSVTDDELEDFRRKFGLKGRTVATFVGDLTSVQNKDCVNFIVDELADKVRDVREDLRFLIVGKGAEAFPNPPANMVFTGYVDKIDPVIAATDIFVAPMRVGAGTKTKVLLFMGYSKPILTTEVGIEGIDVQGRDDVMVRDLSGFPEALRAFRSHEGRKIPHASCINAAQAYSPEVMRSKIDELLSDLKKR